MHPFISQGNNRVVEISHFVTFLTIYLTKKLNQNKISHYYETTYYSNHRNSPSSLLL